jgi:hypothetical protein
MLRVKNVNKISPIRFTLFFLFFCFTIISSYALVTNLSGSVHKETKKNLKERKVPNYFFYNKFLSSLTFLAYPDTVNLGNDSNNKMAFLKFIPNNALAVAASTTSSTWHQPGKLYNALSPNAFENMFPHYIKNQFIKQTIDVFSSKGNTDTSCDDPAHMASVLYHAFVFPLDKGTNYKKVPIWTETSADTQLYGYGWNYWWLGGYNWNKLEGRVDELNSCSNALGLGDAVSWYDITWYGWSPSQMNWSNWQNVPACYTLEPLSPGTISLDSIPSCLKKSAQLLNETPVFQRLIPALKVSWTSSIRAKSGSAYMDNMDLSASAWSKYYSKISNDSVIPIYASMTMTLLLRDFLFLVKPYLGFSLLDPNRVLGRTTNTSIYDFFFGNTTNSSLVVSLHQHYSPLPSSFYHDFVLSPNAPYDAQQINTLAYPTWNQSTSLTLNVVNDTLYSIINSNAYSRLESLKDYTTFKTADQLITGIATYAQANDDWSSFYFNMLYNSLFSTAGVCAGSSPCLKRIKMIYPYLTTIMGTSASLLDQAVQQYIMSAVYASLPDPKDMAQLEIDNLLPIKQPYIEYQLGFEALFNPTGYSPHSMLFPRQIGLNETSYKNWSTDIGFFLDQIYLDRTSKQSQLSGTNPYLALRTSWLPSVNGLKTKIDNIEKTNPPQFEDFQGFIDRENLLPSYAKFPFDRNIKNIHTFINEMISLPSILDILIATSDPLPGVIVSVGAFFNSSMNPTTNSSSGPSSLNNPKPFNELDNYLTRLKTKQYIVHRSESFAHGYALKLSALMLTTETLVEQFAHIISKRLSQSAFGNITPDWRTNSCGAIGDNTKRTNLVSPVSNPGCSSLPYNTDYPNIPNMIGVSSIKTYHIGQGKLWRSNVLKESPADLDREILESITEIIHLMYKIQLNKERILIATSTFGLSQLSAAGINVVTQNQKKSLLDNFLTFSMGTQFVPSDLERSLPYPPY